MNFNEFKTILAAATTEEEVKAIYSRYLKIRIDFAASRSHTPEVLFEFTHRNFQNQRC